MDPASPDPSSEVTLPPGVDHDRRRIPRQTLVAKAVLRRDGRPGGPSFGYVSNITMLGVGFHTQEPLSIGDKYHIRLEVGPLKWSSMLRVVCCNPHESGTYDVGAEFVSKEMPARPPHTLAA